MKLFKSFEQISNEFISLETIFEDKGEFFAHTHHEKKQETLNDHISKVLRYFNILVNFHGIENIIDTLIGKISFNNRKIGEYIKILFLHSIVFHDFGKVNDNFQSDRMNNHFFESDKSIKIGYEHSFLSAYLFINYHFDRINNKDCPQSDKSILWAFSFLFSVPIIKHHSGYLSKDYNYGEEKINSVHRFLDIIGFDIPIGFSMKFIKNEHRIWEYFDEFVKNQSFDYFPLFSLLKLNYSLLTASDYYATSDYMNDLKFTTEDDFGLITADLKKRIFHHFENNDKAKYNGDLIRNIETYISTEIDDLNEKSNKNLNFLRQKLGAEVLNNIAKYTEERVFYIEAPTGGGKTNMSMIAVIKLLEMHQEVNKVFYVFPFTTLITQTAKAIKDTLGLACHEIAQVHSKAGFQSKGNETDAKYGSEMRNQIDNLFVNYPFTLLTHIKFFDILKSNKKSTNYILHRLANSIVVIDELQSYNPEHWDKIKYYISQYSELFNIRFIIMSATLPKIDEIKLADYHFIPFVRLIHQSKKYLQNPNFSERVAIKTGLLNIKNIELDDLANIVFEKSAEYSVMRADGFKNCVYTIIEFIFKKSASKFYSITKEHNDFFDEIFVLSGTIIEPRRKFIIEYLKDEQNRKKKILLITTQVVEAGVDIDMDLGFKNQSLIDSDEQLAGRINRNVNKRGCELWLFNHNTPKSIYGMDFRYAVTQNFEQSFIEDILKNKDFEKLYSEVFKKIEMENKSVYKKNFNDYLEHIAKLNFEKIDYEFKLIDSENMSLFAPLDIGISCYGKENNFSENEIRFIEEHDCLHNEFQVSGEKIWDLYVALVQNKEINFNQKNISLKILNGIMSKFVFSVFMKKAKDMEQYCDYNEQSADYNNFGYFKLKRSHIGPEEIYNLENGINEKLLEKELKQSFDFI